jgi:tetratricopeptide (TPR) repeat protein
MDYDVWLREKEGTSPYKPLEDAIKETVNSMYDQQTLEEITRRLGLDHLNQKISYIMDDWNNHIDEQIAELSEKLRRNPKDAAAYAARGVEYGFKGDSVRSIVDFTMALTLDPNDAPSYMGRGYEYGKMGDFTRQIEDYEKAVKLRPDNPNFRKTLQKAMDGRSDIK